MRRIAVLALLLAACAGDERAAPTTTTTTEAPAPAYPASVEPAPSPGCGTSTVGELRRERREIGDRWYLLSTPPAHDGETPLPLVVELHGLAQGAEGAAGTGLTDELGAEEGFVTVYPHGTGAPVRWHERLDEPDNPDLAFLAALLDELGSELCIDEARTYSMGLSYGAIMSSTLACAMADRIAAIGAVAGLQRPDGCAPARPVPVLAIHGTADPILFFNGGIGDLGAAFTGGSPQPPAEPADLDGPGYPATVAAWADANGCGAAGPDERRSEHVLERAYDCPPEAEVRFLIVEGGGHSWPGSAAHEALERIVGPTTDELDATAELWSFFERHAIGAR